MRLLLPLTALALASPLWAAPAPPRVDYQKKADAAPWRWSEERATAAGCARALPRPYGAEVERRDGFGGAVIRIAKDGNVLHAFRGHLGTAFAVRDDILYYADFDPISSGCALVAYDLRKQKQLWRAQLKGLGPIAHSKYRNAVNLDLDKQAVCVRGKESAGTYLEYVDLRTGKTVGHKKYHLP